MEPLSIRVLFWICLWLYGPMTIVVLSCLEDLSLVLFDQLSSKRAFGRDVGALSKQPEKKIVKTGSPSSYWKIVVYVLWYALSYALLIQISRIPPRKSSEEGEVDSKRVLLLVVTTYCFIPHIFTLYRWYMMTKTYRQVRSRHSGASTRTAVRKSWRSALGKICHLIGKQVGEKIESLTRQILRNVEVESRPNEIITPIFDLYHAITLNRAAFPTPDGFYIVVAKQFTCRFGVAFAFALLCRGILSFFFSEDVITRGSGFWLSQVYIILQNLPWSEYRHVLADSLSTRADLNSKVRTNSGKSSMRSIWFQLLDSSVTSCVCAELVAQLFHTTSYSTIKYEADWAELGPGVWQDDDYKSFRGIKKSSEAFWMIRSDFQKLARSHIPLTDLSQYEPDSLEWCLAAAARTILVLTVMSSVMQVRQQIAVSVENYCISLTYPHPTRANHQRSSDNEQRQASSDNSHNFTVALVKRPAFSNTVKLWVENLFRQRFLWWPLSEPDRPIAKHTARMTWKCSCGSNVYFNVPNGFRNAGDALRADLQNHLAGARSNGGILPTYHTQPSGTLNFASPLNTTTQISASAQASASSDTGQVGNINSSPSNLTSTPNTTRPNGYIYWCVDGSTGATQVCEFTTRTNTDKSLIAGLRNQYSAIVGWWYGFWTMTSCAGVSFKKFRYLFDDLDLVHCNPKPELPNTNDKQYEYTRIDPLDEYRAWLEARISHYIQSHSHRSSPLQSSSAQLLNPADNYDLLSRIPKKTPSRLSAKAYVHGYGMHAIQAISLVKLLLMLALWQTGSFVFAIYWLCVHGGDLQNAFVIFTTTLAGFMLYLEVLVRFRRR